MASQKYLDLLSSGKTLWNAWRRADADVQAVEPDLYGADLRDTTLCHANLKGADLSQADLRGADLDGASLGNTKLDEAKGLGGDLSGANPDLAEAHGAVRAEIWV
jgi:uncharacterized protein YjbI with pentapeptide repeats